MGVTRRGDGELIVSLPSDGLAGTLSGESPRAGARSSASLLPATSCEDTVEVGPCRSKPGVTLPAADVRATSLHPRVELVGHGAEEPVAHDERFEVRSSHLTPGVRRSAVRLLDEVQGDGGGDGVVEKKKAPTNRGLRWSGKRDLNLRPLWSRSVEWSIAPAWHSAHRLPSMRHHCDRARARPAHGAHARYVEAHGFRRHSGAGSQEQTVRTVPRGQHGGRCLYHSHPMSEWTAASGVAGGGGPVRSG